MTDALLFRTAPFVALASVLAALATLPLAPGVVALPLSVGLFLFIVALGPFMVALMDAGWASGRAVGVVATFRAAAHIVAYEVPFGFAVIGPAMMARSLDPVRIVEAQERLWFVVLQPMSFLVYLGAALLLAYRHPFALPFAGAELEGGVAAPYGRAERALFAAARALILVAVALAGAVSFLGGWLGPLLPPLGWTALKTAALVALFLFVPRRLRRARVEQALAWSWKVLLPASLVNIVLVGIVALWAGGAGLLP